MSKARATYDFRRIEPPRLTYSPARGEFYRYGEDNLYPYYLNAYLESPIHKGIIETKVYYITQARKILYPNADGLWIEDGQTWAQYMEQLARDYEISNQAYITVRRVSNGWLLGSIPFYKVRVGTNFDKYFVSENWTRPIDKTEIPDISQMPIADPPVGQIYIYRLAATPTPALYDLENRYSLTSLVYPQPTYAGGIYAILADIESQKYQYHEIANSFKGGTLVELPDIFKTEEERRKIAQQIKDELTSSESETGIVVTFRSLGAEQGANIQPISGSDTAARYSTVRQDIITSIVVAHSVTSPELIGVAIPGQLGGTTSREESYAIFEQTYIAGRRNALVTAVNKVLKLLKLPAQITVEQPETQGQTMVSFASVDTVVDLFARSGMPRSKVSAWIASEPVVGRDDWHAVLEFASHEEFRPAYKPTEQDLQLIEMVSAGSDLNHIIQAFQGKRSEVVRRLANLIKLGYIKMPDANNPLRPTVKGLVAIHGRQNLRVVYTYEERPDAPPLLTQSRPFCRRMLTLNKAYTRDEVDRISSIIGRDVWTYRGGWYHNWQTGQNEPACRHEWRQHLVRV
jgi:hypothetical protein